MIFWDNVYDSETEILAGSISMATTSLTPHPFDFDLYSYVLLGILH